MTRRPRPGHRAPDDEASLGEASFAERHGGGGAGEEQGGEGERGPTRDGEGRRPSPDLTPPKA